MMNELRLGKMFRVINRSLTYRARSQCHGLYKELRSTLLVHRSNPNRYFGKGLYVSSAIKSKYITENNRYIAI